MIVAARIEPRGRGANYSTGGSTAPAQRQRVELALWNAFPAQMDPAPVLQTTPIYPILLA
jgi:hypothetical protein